MSQPTVRKRAPYVPLSKDQFRERFFARFRDPAFDAVRAELERVCEVLGGLGLVLPQLTQTMPGLTPLAAAGLVVIMIGATVVSFMGGGVTAALFPFIVLVLCVVVARGRAGAPAR